MWVNRAKMLPLPELMEVHRVSEERLNFYFFE